MKLSLLQRSYWLAFLGSIFLVACTQKNTDSASGTSSSSDSAPNTSTLTEKQISEGWRALFDGKSLNGWQFYKGRKNNTWEVVDGVLHCKAVNESVQGDGDERSDLMTTATFENFDLLFDWKIASAGNSGVIFHVTEEFEQPYYSGPEYQLIDDVGFPEKLKDTQMTGANYDVHATPSKILKKVGEWNSSRILVNGNHVEHWLNGQKIVEYEMGSDDWKRRVAASKWKDSPGYAMAKAGHIDLQDHGSEIWFRNILIKPL